MVRGEHCPLQDAVADRNFPTLPPLGYPAHPGASLHLKLALVVRNSHGLVLVRVCEDVEDDALFGQSQSPPNMPATLILSCVRRYRK